MPMIGKAGKRSDNVVSQSPFIFVPLDLQSKLVVLDRSLGSVGPIVLLPANTLLRLFQLHSRYCLFLSTTTPAFSSLTPYISCAASLELRRVAFHIFLFFNSFQPGLLPSMHHSVPCLSLYRIRLNWILQSCNLVSLCALLCFTLLCCRCAILASITK